VDVHTGGRYDPAADTWTATSTDHVIEAREFHTMVWTGSEILIWGGQTAKNGYTHIGGRYLLSSSGNSAPQTSADAYETLAGAELVIAAPGVLENDFDPDGDPLTANLTTAPPSGVLNFNSDGSFSYMPANGFTGTVQFQYQASDGQTVSSPTTVTIQVTQDAPLPEFWIYLPVIVRP
ncbi:MAG TPA: cadherin-like domain-containing protein, partial [Anaerolineales bacterium]|nr:cadherin-like domain-containing protein [Anaerolineales bacterium]